MKYRPDIDGLRAIAILLVLIYHGGLFLLPSGFVGVDVFFVISGFLISGIIYQSLNDKCFSFMDFYNRRLWRLQPVLLCFIFITSVITLLLFLPDDLIQYASSARKTSLFLSNIFFNHTTTGYFSPDTQQLPLLHTWSLSIEWQCYFILPVAMYGLYRCLSKKNLLVAVYGLALISFLLTLFYSHQFPAQTYYQFSSRIFEFLIGACVALTPWKRHIKNAFVLDLIGCLAVVLIFYIASLNHILLGYPNGYALIVCMTTALLLVLGEFYPNLLIIKILSSKPLVFVGLLSYSLYIWHWAVFAILRYQNIHETPMILLMAFGLTFILAYLSWRYIEKPSRRCNKTNFKYTFASLVLLPIIVVHSAAYITTIYQGFPQRFNKELATVYQKLQKYESAKRPLCISNNHIDITSQCLIGAKKINSKKGLMIGDSFSNHYWGFMDILGRTAGVSLLVQGTSSCITLPGIYLYDWWHFKDQVYQECRDQTENYYRMIRNNHYDYVIIGQMWDNYLSDKIINHLGDQRSLDLSKKRLEIALEQALAEITASGAKPVLIKTTAKMQENFHDCFFRHIKMHQPYDPNECHFTLTLSDEDCWFNQLFAAMKNKYPQLILIDPKVVQCQKGVCTADINGVPVYRDIGHITDYASYHLGRLYVQKFHNPLL